MIMPVMIRMDLSLRAVGEKCDCRDEKGFQKHGSNVQKDADWV
jgi:hypothetical protein